jgi:predicted  nucleic acid-binding Zn-ribbon protein
MDSQIEYIAALSMIDEMLDDLEDEYGDLPDQLKKIQEKVNEKERLVEETENILNDIRSFCRTSKTTLVDLKDREEKLAKKQFHVRNNKEFDAITKEIENIRQEHEHLSDKLRTEGVKEENLVAILDKQKEEAEAARNEYKEKSEEVEVLTKDQNEELKELVEKRAKITSKIDPHYFAEYERIRTLYNDAAVKILKNSCSGCFSAVPPQIIVEMRNKFDTVYYCQTCGRIMIPGEAAVEETEIEEM